VVAYLFVNCRVPSGASQADPWSSVELITSLQAATRV
jgi:hypothetical protein